MHRHTLLNKTADTIRSGLDPANRVLIIPGQASPGEIPWPVVTTDMANNSTIWHYYSLSRSSHIFTAHALVDPAQDTIGYIYSTRRSTELASLLWPETRCVFDTSGKCISAVDVAEHFHRILCSAKLAQLFRVDAPIRAIGIRELPFCFIVSAPRVTASSVDAGFMLLPRRRVLAGLIGVSHPQRYSPIDPHGLRAAYHPSEDPYFYVDVFPNQDHIHVIDARGVAMSVSGMLLRVAAHRATTTNERHCDILLLCSTSDCSLSSASCARVQVILEKDARHCGRIVHMGTSELAQFNFGIKRSGNGMNVVFGDGSIG